MNISANTTRLTGHEAIEAFQDAGRAGEGIRVWSYSPNGGAGGPMGSTEWGSDDWVDEILSGEALGLDPESVEFEYDPSERTLKIRTVRERGRHQYYSLNYQETPDAGRERIAYLGAHAGFSWEGAFDAEPSDSLRTLPRYLGWDDEDLAEFGLASCEDFEYGDDGGFWLVDDETKFAATLAKCRELDQRYEDLDAEDVIAYLRDGTEPVVEDPED